MTIYSEIKLKLEERPDFRERRFRSKGLAILALRSLELEGRYYAKLLTLDDLINFAGRYDSYRHEYDAVQRDFPHLQGEDYSDGKALAQEKQVEFGYVPGYHEDIKKLALIN